MGNLMVSVLGSPGYSNGLGKKGTSTDITLYNLKKGADTVTFVEPTRYPERLAPLFYATSAAKIAIVVVDEINAFFGECVVMLHCCGVKSGYFVLRNYVSREKVEPLIKGTSLEKFEFIEDDPVLLKEKLLALATEEKPVERQVGGAVSVDHAFNVKGVGVVVLGVVKRGSIEKHAELRVLPAAKSAQVRSIQKHDDEFDLATEGDRVGLALKNVDVEELDRGTVLTSDPSIKVTKELKTQVGLVRYWQAPMKSEMVLHLGHWMQFVPCRVEAVSDEADWRKPVLTLTLEKPLIHRPGDNAVVAYLEGGKLRVAGTAELP
jgi:selenocysteine-specific translation elongation factor